MQWVKSTRKRRRLLRSESGSTSGRGNTFRLVFVALFSLLIGAYSGLWDKRESKISNSSTEQNIVERNGARRNIVSSYFEVQDSSTQGLAIM